MRWNCEKAVQTANYLANANGGEIDITQLMLLVFLADRGHLRRYGRTITGDSYVATTDGPRPVNLFNLLAKGHKDFKLVGRANPMLTQILNRRDQPCHSQADTTDDDRRPGKQCDDGSERTSIEQMKPEGYVG